MYLRWIVVLIVCVISATGSASDERAPKYRIIEVLDSTLVNAYDINDQRMIVGTYLQLDETGEIGTTHGYARLNRYLNPITLPDVQSLLARGLNDRGVVVGLVSFSDGRENGFRFADGVFTPVQIPDSTVTVPSDINNRGQIVGWATINWRQHAFLLSQDNVTLIAPPEASGGPVSAESINDQGEFVGFYEPAGTLSETDGFVFRNDRYFTIRFPDAPRTFPLAINDKGQIAGFYTDSAFIDHGFFFWRGRFMTIDIPNSVRTQIHGMNDQGDIVGIYRDAATGITHAFQSNIKEFASRM
jgi:probable HAF family extracellular repeat protein